MKYRYELHYHQVENHLNRKISLIADSTKLSKVGRSKCFTGQIFPFPYENSSWDLAAFSSHDYAQS